MARRITLHCARTLELQNKEGESAAPPLDGNILPEYLNILGIGQ